MSNIELKENLITFEWFDGPILYLANDIENNLYICCFDDKEETTEVGELIIPLSIESLIKLVNNIISITEVIDKSDNLYYRYLHTSRDQNIHLVEKRNEFYDILNKYKFTSESKDEVYLLWNKI